MHACFEFSKPNIYNFENVFDFSDFSKKIENLGMLHTTNLKRNLVPRFEEARKNGFESSGFRQMGGLPPLKENFVGSLEIWIQTGHIWCP